MSSRVTAYGIILRRDLSRTKKVNGVPLASYRIHPNLYYFEDVPIHELERYSPYILFLVPHINSPIALLSFFATVRSLKRLRSKLRSAGCKVFDSKRSNHVLAVGRSDVLQKFFENVKVYGGKLSGRMYDIVFVEVAPLFLLDAIRVEIMLGLRIDPLSI